VLASIAGSSLSCTSTAWKNRIKSIRQKRSSIINDIRVTYFEIVNLCCRGGSHDGLHKHNAATINKKWIILVLLGSKQ
jgi:hypothetical protein